MNSKILSQTRSILGQFHWSVRIAQLALILAILFWQSRHIFHVHNPMYGWPIPFNNVWYTEFREWHPTTLIANVLVWATLSVSLGSVLQRLRMGRFGLAELIVIPTVIAILMELALIEFYLRRNPNNDSIFPKYAHLQAGPIDLWFDIGLFSDPPSLWLIARIPIIISIGCVLYWPMSRLIAIVRRQGRQPSEHANDVKIPYTPWAARMITWLFIAAIFFYSFLTLTPPLVR